MTETTVGQFVVPPTAGVDAAASQIAAASQTGPVAAGIVPSLRKATVISNNGGTPPTCTITFDGTTNVTGIQYVTSWDPVANDVVNCFILDGVAWITEKVRTVLDPPPPAPPVFPMAIGRQTGTQTMASGSNYGANVCESVEYDSDGMIINANTFRPPTAGYYVMTASVVFSTAPVGGTYRQLGIYLNVSTQYGFIRAEQASGGFPNSVGAALNVTSMPIYCNGSGDSLQAIVAQNSGSAIDLIGCYGAAWRVR